MSEDKRDLTRKQPVQEEVHTCVHCQKTFPSEEGLITHSVLKHPGSWKQSTPGATAGSQSSSGYVPVRRPDDQVYAIDELEDAFATYCKAPFDLVQAGEKDAVSFLGCL